MKTYKKLLEDIEPLVEVKFPWVVVDTADDNKVVAMASDESDAKSSISSAERPPMNIKDKSTLKIVKTRRKQHGGMPLVEGQESVELLDETLKDYFAKQVKSQEDAKKLSKSQLATLKKEYAKVDKIDPTTSAYKRMRNKLTSLPDVVLQQIVDAEIKFLRVDAASIIKGRKK